MYAYNLKKTLITSMEQKFFSAIKKALPEGYLVFPQINLATFIQATDSTVYHNELFRNVDFLVTDAAYKPRIAIEINDQTHRQSDRKERDKKVKDICAEAGIPLVSFWTSYGVNQEYIQKKITETLDAPPLVRLEIAEKKKHTKSKKSVDDEDDDDDEDEDDGEYRAGCYIATCVYGSYDCPEVWVLRRYRDNTLARTWFGRLFIRFYYAVSPKLVRLFGSKNWFRKLWKPQLDRKVFRLRKQGVADSPYEDPKY